MKRLVLALLWLTTTAGVVVTWAVLGVVCGASFPDLAHHLAYNAALTFVGCAAYRRIGR